MKTNQLRNRETIKMANSNIIILKKPGTQTNKILEDPPAPHVPFDTSGSSSKQGRPLDNRASLQCFEDPPGRLQWI